MLNTDDEEKKIQYGYIYQKALRYQGNQDFKVEIDKKEKILRSIRKKISTAEYEANLRRIILMRNEYAKQLNFRNYLEMQFDDYGVDKTLLENKINRSWEKIYKNYDEYISLENKQNIKIENNCLNYENQLILAQRTTNKIGIKLNEFPINFHIEQNEKKVCAGAVVPINIPDDIHVINKPVSGLGAFASVFMHEVGHALYFSNIDKTLPYAIRNTYNSIMDEGIALFFENLVFSHEWFNEFLSMEYPKNNIKECFSIPQQICCMCFERDIYNNPELSFDEVWQYNSKKYLYHSDYSWIQPHFFVSAPGYFSAYLLGELFARDLRDFLIESNGRVLTDNTGKFFLEKVFKSGKKLDFVGLLETIHFNN